MSVPNTVTLQVTFPDSSLSFEVPWFLNMNVQQLLESACLVQEALGNPALKFTLTYSGQTSPANGVLGYEVISFNDVANNEDNSSYWVFTINDKTSEEGIDSCVLRPNDVISFVYTVSP